MAAVMCAPLFLGGCFDRQELEGQAFVSTLGIDKAPGGLVDCTFRIALPVNPSAGGATGKTPLAGTSTITYRAHNVDEAMLLANSSIERQMTFSHLTLILFGDELAKSGVLPYIQPLVRFREFRRTVMIGVTHGSAKDVIASTSPVLEQNANRVADSIKSMGQRSGLIPVAQVHDLASAIDNPHQDLAVPLYAVNSIVADDRKGKKPVEGEGVNYSAGQIRRTGGDPIEWIGAAVLHGDRKVDELNGQDAIRLNLLRGRLREGKMDFSDPIHPHGKVGVIVHKEHVPRYHVMLGNPVKIQVEVPLDLDIINVERGVNYALPQTRQKLERSIDDQLGASLTNLLKKLMVKDHVDVIPVSQYIRRDFPTYQAFVAYPWEDKMKTADISVRVEAHVRRFGVQLDPLEMAQH